MKPSVLASALITLAERTTPKKAVASLAHMLEGKGKLKLLQSIKRSIERAQHERSRTHSTVVVARESDATLAQKATKDTAATLVIDETIIGGFRHITKNVLTDASHKSHLEALFTRITQ
jgi:F0F1-type ATP synthase delta subunit